MEGVSLGPLFLRWNGLSIAFGIALGAFVSALEARRRYQEIEIIHHLFVPLVLWGWIGSRLWHILTPPLSSVQLGLTTRSYLSHPLDILSFWTGGFGIPGAILGGTLALWLVCRKEGLPFWEMTDLLAPGIAVAHALGRVGNYFNQELYGAPTEIPWAIFIAPENRLIGFEQAEFYHPLFAYEAALVAAVAFLLIWLSRGRFASQVKPGEIYLGYLACYSLIRFCLEYLRLDVALVNEVNVNQVFFAALFLLTAVIFARRRLARDL